MKRFLVFLLIAFSFTATAAWDEFNQYTVADELKKPGVKLVAVDFYATWCEPCNKAIPKWRKLQEKYGDKGFKLIVVSVQSGGSCSQPPKWNPDKIICDFEGDIADSWHANDLPQAFLWSWQGNALVSHGTVDDVESAVEKYFKNVPRVFVEEGADRDIYRLVRSELSKNSKIEVVASDEERKALAELRKKSAELNYDTKLQCKLGEEISANSRLVISKTKYGSKNMLVLELFSVEKGCLTASGTAQLRGKTDTEVAEAVYNLLKNLLGEVAMPGTVEKAAPKPKQSGSLQDAKACEYARSEAKIKVWEAYLKKFPDGECSFEATLKIDELKAKDDKNGQIKAENTAPEIKPIPPVKTEKIEPLKLEKKEPKRGLAWSQSALRSRGSEAVETCKNLREGGFSDWRLPTIDELRTLVQNCPDSEPGGKCGVSEKCSGKGCFDRCGMGCKPVENANPAAARASRRIQASRGDSVKYSRFGDMGTLWSSTVFDREYRWAIDFTTARIHFSQEFMYSGVRCVRFQQETSK